MPKANEHNENNKQKSGSHEAGYEKRDVNLTKVLVYGIAGIIILVIVVIFVVDQFNAIKEEIVYEQVLRPESAALRELRVREVEELGSYKLLNEKESIYRVPIERAKQLLADEAYRDRIKQAGKK